MGEVMIHVDGRVRSATPGRTAGELLLEAGVPEDELLAATINRHVVGLQTPVWAAEADGVFYIFSAGNAGKVKRLRNSARARLAVCDVRGRLLGDWHEAEAELIHDADEIAKALSALRRKYGVQMWLADLGARLSGRFDKRSYIRARLQN